MPERTIPNLFEESVKKYNNNVLMWERDFEKFIGTKYGEVQPLVHKFAAGLISYGIKHGDRIALISEGRNDWVISELGILFAGAVNVPISVKVDEAADLKFRLAHSECRMVIVSANQRGKIQAIKNDLPDLEKIILLDNTDNPDRDEISKSEIIGTGEKYLAQHRAEFENRWESIKENDYANICYTSGTTRTERNYFNTSKLYCER